MKWSKIQNRKYMKRTALLELWRIELFFPVQSTITEQTSWTGFYTVELWGPKLPKRVSVSSILSISQGMLWFFSFWVCWKWLEHCLLCVAFWEFFVIQTIGFSFSLSLSQKEEEEKTVGFVFGAVNWWVLHSSNCFNVL